MSDIRGFFGGAKAYAAPSPKKAVKAPAKDVDEGMLVDSDDDAGSGKARVKSLESRKRLKSSKEVVKEEVERTASKTELAPGKTHEIDLTKVEAKRAPSIDFINTISPKKARVASPKQDQSPDSPPLLGTYSPTTSKSNVKELGAGGAAAFFGGTSNGNENMFTSSPSAKNSIHKKNPGSGKKKGKATASNELHLEGCFGGKKFGVSGTFAESVTRAGIEDLIKENGGKISSKVTSVTDYLVIGKILENNKPPEEGNKYQDAMKHSTPILTEEQLRAMIPVIEIAPINIAREAAASTSASAPAPMKAALKSVVKTVEPVDDSELLWVDKHKPSKAEDMIGNVDTVRNLKAWLSRYHMVHIKKQQKVSHSKENPGAKAVLLSGPPGIGKSTLAGICAKELGYEILELNASDTRSKKAVTEQLADVVLSQAMDSHGGLKKRLVIMDEVDGMGGSDRGGIPELIKVVKNAKSPIICICNDRQAQKIRSLANHCYDLRVKRPTKSAIAKRMVAIGRLEGLQVDENAAEMLVEQSGNDIRQAIHAMQMWRAQSTTMKYGELKQNMKRIEKDKVLRQSPFDACLQILAGPRNSQLPLMDRYNSFFVDYSLIPLLVQQNYIESARAGGIFKDQTLDDGQRMTKLADASMAVADMELIGSSIMGMDQHWELLPAQAMFACRVGHIVQGYQGFPTFPQWLGKLSTTNKNKRLVTELVRHSQHTIGCSSAAMRRDYLPYFRDHMLSTLMNTEKDQGENIKESIELLDHYGFSRDDFMDSMASLQIKLPPSKIPPDFGSCLLLDRYEKLDTKLKTALTRTYNSGEHRSQALVGDQQASKSKKKKAGNEDLPTGTTEDLEAAKADEEDDQEEDISAFVKKMTAAKKSAPKKKKKEPATKKAKTK